MSATDPAPDAELHVRLRDGTRALIRPIRPDDKQRLEEGLEQLSPRSRYLRFHAPVDRLTERQLRYFTEIDYADHMAWVALDEDDPRSPGMGVARYVRLAGEPTVAEAALTVLDRYQGRGLGTVLLGVLGRSAVQHDIDTFRNYVLAENEEMLGLFRQLGASIEQEEEPGVCRVDVPLPDDPDQLPDTPAGRVVSAVAGSARTLPFGRPLWVEDEAQGGGDEGIPTEDARGPQGAERQPLRDWLDETLDALEL